MPESKPFPNVVRDLENGIKSCQQFIDNSPRIREEIEEQANTKIRELEQNVAEATKLRGEYAQALIALGVPLSEDLSPASETEMESEVEDE